MNRFRSIAAGIALALSGAAFAAEPVDINTASAEALAEAISGVGLKRAEAIVAYRDTHGPFRSVDDLVAVSGVGERTVERSRERLRVGDSAQ